MNPEQNLDQDAVRLAKAIRNVESRDDINAKGKSGEFGLYQFMPDTWASTTKKYNLDASDLSRENQNKAAYMQIKELKDQGLSPDKIAAFWNSGKTEGWENMRGVNKYGVKYDVPKYVSGVQQAYEQLKTSETGGQSIITPSTVGHQETVDPRTTTEKAAKGLIDLNIGAIKGAGRTITGAMEQGETIANQTAGRVVSAITGRGFKPLPEEELGGNIARLPQVKEALAPTNTAQKIGGYAEKAGEVLLPGGAVGTMALKARAAARVFDDALDIVAPKLTAKTIRDGIRQGRGIVSGVFREVGMSPDKATEAAARAVQGIVKKGKTSAENANAVLEAIGKEADSLVQRLKTMDITPTVTQEELGALFKKASDEIGENPTMVGNAGETAARIFNKFKTFLPQKGDITAEHLLDARKKLDAWIRSQKGTKVFDPATDNALTVGLRTIRQNLNDLIAEKAPDVNVKESLNLQSAMYDAVEGIASKGAEELGSTGPGRLLKKIPFAKGLIPTVLGGGALSSYITAKVLGD